MDLIEAYKLMDSYYEIGMGVEIRDYLNEKKETKKINKYSLDLVDDEIVICINQNHIDIHSFVYDFLSYISYDFFCSIQRKEDNEYIVYYIYTKMNEYKMGIKIQIKFIKSL